MVVLCYMCTGKKTPGGAGTHTGNTGAHEHTEDTDEHLTTNHMYMQTYRTTKSQPRTGHTYIVSQHKMCECECVPAP